MVRTNWKYSSYVTMALFPSGSESGRGSPLFPSTTATHQAPESHDSGRDWLKNESYQPQPLEVKGGNLSGTNSEGIRHSPPLPPPPGAPPSSHSTSGKRHKKHRSKHHKQQRKSSPLISSSSSSSSSVPLKPNTIWIEDSGLDPKDAYRMDRVPDRSNLHYDTLYSGSVTSYRRAFGSHTLGLEPDQWAEFGIGHGKKQKRDKPVRYFSKVLAPSVLLVMHKGRAPRTVSVEEYLSLSKPEEGRQEEEDEEEQEEEGEEGGRARAELTVEHYLSQCTADYNRQLLREPKNVSLWMEFIAFQDHALLWGRTAGVYAGQETGGGPTGKTRIATIERKLSILERALESNPFSVELLGAQMGLAREVWEPGKILRRWKDLVFQQPNQPLLWLNYIQFCRSQFSTFSTPSLSSLYTKSLSTLSAIQEGTLRSHQPGPLSSRFMLAIFVLYCHYLRQAGHSERAVASFQALLEFNLCCPPEVDAAELTMKERLDFFETFCDSGVPRIGEEGATGWRGWMSATQQGGEATGLAAVDVPSHYKATNKPETVKEEEEEEEDPEVAMVAGRPLHEAWVMMERRREREESLPLRGEGEEECTDPDRMVLFDDIRPALFRLTDPSLQLQAVLSFLHFLGVPIPTSTPLTLSPPHTSSPLTLTPHHTSSCITSFHEVSPPFLPFSSPAHLQHSFQPLGAGSKLHPLPTSLSDWATGGHTHIITSTNHPHNVGSFVSNVFSQTLGLFSDPKSQTLVAEAWLGYEIAALSAEGIFSSQKLSKEQRQRVKGVQKLVKAMLKLEIHRNNLCLWNCCALVELYLSGVRDSVKIYQAILSQHQPRKEGERDDSELSLLYRCFSEVTLGLRTPLLPPPLPTSSSSFHPLTLHTLVSLTEGTYRLPASDKPSPSPAHVLKARHTFQLQSQERRRDTHWTICHAYFEYVTRGMKTACSVLDSHVTILVEQLNGTERRSREHELVLQALEDTYQVQVRLLHHHSLSHPLPPSLLRGSLERALSHFPDHGGLLASFTENEQQSFISGRLRRYFDTHTSSSSSSPVPWLYAIRAELQRYSRLTAMASVVREGGGGGGGGGGESSSEPASGVLHRVRGLLQRATQSSSGQTCPLLWRLYMKFEIEQQNFTQAKALFYQAIHHCPWAKVLYVDAAEHFPSELSHIAELMEEKELRMRAPLEEVKLLLSARGSAVKEKAEEEQQEDMDCL